MPSASEGGNRTVSRILIDMAGKCGRKAYFYPFFQSERSVIRYAFSGARQNGNNAKGRVIQGYSAKDEHFIDVAARMCCCHIITESRPG